MKILVLGGASYDDIIHVNEFFLPEPKTIFAEETYSMCGSTGIGKALAFKKLGYDVTLQANIGNDYYGDLIVKEMKNAGIDFKRFLDEETQRHTNILDAHGRRISIFHNIKSTKKPDINSFEPIIKNCDIVCLNIIDYCRDFIPIIKLHKKPIYCDLHDYNLGNPYYNDFIEAADALLLSSEQMSNYQVFMENMIDKGKQWVVVTHGEFGASAMDETKTITNISADSIPLVDTNGAGDCFFAGFIYGITNSYNLEKSLIMGKLAANDCIMSKKIVGDKLSREYLEKKLSETEKNS